MYIKITQGNLYIKTTQGNLYIKATRGNLNTVKPVYKGHSRESENVALMSSCPFQYRLKSYVLFINGKMRLPFIDSDLLYRGALLRQV
jgi:hypothetical protein